jgi:3-oxoacyl-(acyl-carrier-protein) synthase
MNDEANSKHENVRLLNTPVSIIGCEILTPLGDGRATWEALRAGRRVERENAVAEEFLEGEEWLDRSIRIGLGVARRALAGMKNFKHEDATKRRTTKELEEKGELEDGAMKLFCGTSKGPVGVMLEVYGRVRRGEAVTVEQARQVALGVGAMGTILGERLGLGAGVTSVAACSSGIHALHAAVRALRRGECARALVVAADASLHPLFEGAFGRLGVLAPRDAADVRRCVPFGAEGRGFFLSEAGAAVVIGNREWKIENRKRETSGAVGKTPRAGRGLAFLEESWIGGDGTGLVAVDEGTETLRRGLRACRGDGMAFVHAHATGTAHDGYEREAIRAVCGDAVEVFSHKGWLGHSLGAAGLVSVALSAMCHERGETWTGVKVGAGAASLTVGQGFGGHVGVVRLRGMGDDGVRDF